MDKLERSIPQLYFDIIARIVPGAMALICYFYIMADDQEPKLSFDIGFIIPSYFVGIALDHFGDFLEKYFYKITFGLVWRFDRIVALHCIPVPLGRILKNEGRTIRLSQKYGAYGTGEVDRKWLAEAVLYRSGIITIFCVSIFSVMNPVAPLSEYILHKKIYALILLLVLLCCYFQRKRGLHPLINPKRNPLFKPKRKMFLRIL